MKNKKKKEKRTGFRELKTQKLLEDGTPGEGWELYTPSL
jgi:hypothetical protein